MCGRYTVTAGRARLTEIFSELAALDGATAACERFNVCPTEDVLAVAGGREDRPPRAALLRWGLVPHWARDARVGARMINARSETVAAKAPYAELVASARGRCLVVADGFYEWLRAEDPRKPRVPLHFALADRAPFAFAGLWTTWRPRDGGGRVASCTILTTRPSAEVRPVHDRMPVILADAGERAAWLDPALDGDAVAPLLRPLPDGLLRAQRANPRVNTAGVEGADCLDGAPAGEDAGAPLQLF